MRNDRRREQQRDGGRKATLATLADKLVFILFYFRMYPTQVAQGSFFGISQGQACTWIHYLTPLLNQALGHEQQLPARQPATVTQVLATCPDLTFIVDGTERPIQRPKDADRQRKYYSGKKKRHTVKNIIVTDKGTRKIKALGPTCVSSQFLG
ncbi:MAG: transposase [Anaerolineae bacterium]|nr:MAG: transposase [Anaerolineae bacterium]